MKKIVLSFVITLIAVFTAAAQTDALKYELPELHTIKTVTLSPSYSCRSPEDFKKGYVNTALFLSAYAKERNSPDLLFNGACKSGNYFDASTAGDGFSLIADLGTDVSLEEVSASRAFNLRRINTPADYSKFVQETEVKPNHVYAVLLNERDKRGLFLFKVSEFVEDKKVVLQYAVKSYQIMLNSPIRSEGFSWDQTSK